MDLKKYKGLLALLSKTLAGLATEAVAVSGRKKHPNLKKLKKLEVKLNHEVKIFLSAKEECSFFEGLRFTEDNAFIGFSIEDGVIHGDMEKAKEWASRYYRDDIDLTDDNMRYCYEVACYVLSLALYQ